MKHGAWKKRITEACKAAHTYEPFFDFTIATLAGILEKRDEAETAYREDGSGPVVEFTNKNGSTNKVKNPYITLWDDLNKTALGYWRDLGLTPAGLKKLKEKHFQNGEEDRPLSLMDRLESMRRANG